MSQSLIYKYCDESFPVLKELMRHKNLKHIEKIDFCWDFPPNLCENGDENCWFIHQEPETLDNYKCNICEKKNEIQHLHF